MSEHFQYRNVLAAWINDLSSVPRVEPWPSPVLDEPLERDILAFFDMMREVGLNSIVLAGLLATWELEPDFRSGVPPDRDRAVRRILDGAHERGVQVLSLLGVYSWGYDKIIREDPRVQGTNPHVMCPSREASHQKMAQCIDYLLETYPFDGFHLESGDLGRCDCDRCRDKPDVLYHVEMNDRTARYVRSKSPGAVLELYTPAVNRSREDWLQWQDCSGHLDFLIDDWNRAGRLGCWARKQVIESLKCAYGTRSGVGVYPPQRWERLRWFLPTVDVRAQHYRVLAENGGRAAQMTGGPIANPSVEITLRCSGKLLQDPFRSAAEVLTETVEELFQPRTREAAEELADIFWAAEKAYMATAVFYPEGGELYLEPLFGAAAGPPFYLEAFIQAHKVPEYERAIQAIQQRFARIRAELGDQGRAGRVQRCIEGALEDVRQIQGSGRMLASPYTW